jgi:hypothetical protein
MIYTRCVIVDPSFPNLPTYKSVCLQGVSVRLLLCLAVHLERGNFITPWKVVLVRGYKTLIYKDQWNTWPDINSMDYPAFSSDGWRKKYCESGANLKNFNSWAAQVTTSALMGRRQYCALGYCSIVPVIAGRST